MEIESEIEIEGNNEANRYCKQLTTLPLAPTDHELKPPQEKDGRSLDTQWVELVFPSLFSSPLDHSQRELHLP